MFRFVALFALVAVAAAEPQWYGWAPAMDAAHMKTASGDTVSVAAKKAEHLQMKASEYAIKGYGLGLVKPAIVAATPAVASPVVYNGAWNGLYNTYSGAHLIGKREAEADSQWIANAGVWANGYNGYALPKAINTVASPVVYNSMYNGLYNGLYNTYSGAHLIGKREAEADSQWITNAGVWANGYNGYALPKAINTVASPVVYNNMYNGLYNGLYNTYSGAHLIGKREAEADSQWINNGIIPYAGYTGYTGLTGYTTPYAYGNLWNRAQWW